MTKKQATEIIIRADIANALGEWSKVNQKEYIAATLTLRGMETEKRALTTIVGDSDEVARIRSLKGAARLAAVTEARRRKGFPTPEWSAKHGAFVITK
jgi:hypothetical protein